jgi:hypothetical protein
MAARGEVRHLIHVDAATKPKKMDTVAQHGKERGLGKPTPKSIN